MAVQTSIYGKSDIQYEGCVINTFERNGYEDSDFYAECWDREKQEVVQIEYDSTRCGGGGYAKIDATKETILEVYRYYKKNATYYFDNVYNEKNAKLVRKGDLVEVVRGRKIPKGTVGKVFWIGTRFNSYNYQDEQRVGIEVEDGTRLFLPLDYVTVIGWEDRLIHGKERKKMIRNNAINSMPRHYRHLFLKRSA